MSNWQWVPTSLQFYFRKPKKGETWGYISRSTNPWDDSEIIPVFVKDVIGKHICYTFHKNEINSACNRWEDRISLIKDFKELYAPVEWLKTQLV